MIQRIALVKVYKKGLKYLNKYKSGYSLESKLIKQGIWINNDSERISKRQLNNMTAEVDFIRKVKRLGKDVIFEV